MGVSSEICDAISICVILVAIYEAAHLILQQRMQQRTAIKGKLQLGSGSRRKSLSWADTGATSTSPLQKPNTHTGQTSVSTPPRALAGATAASPTTNTELIMVKQPPPASPTVSTSSTQTDESDEEGPVSTPRVASPPLIASPTSSFSKSTRSLASPRPLERSSTSPGPLERSSSSPGPAFVVSQRRYSDPHSLANPHPSFRTSGNKLQGVGHHTPRAVNSRLHLAGTQIPTHPGPQYYSHSRTTNGGWIANPSHMRSARAYDKPRPAAWLPEPRKNVRVYSVPAGTW